jgi:lipopolysaccharide export system permease protein
MSTLGRYIILTVLGYTALVMLLLLALGALFLFIGQQDDIGTGGYTVLEALRFVALNLPKYAFDLLPVGALIGGLLGLGNLARGSELVVIRASGVSTLRFCAWLGAAGLLLAALMFVLGEFIAPPLEKYALQLKIFSKHSQFSFAGDRGTWARDGDTIISVEQQSASTRYGGVQLFQFDPQRRLLSIGRAESASLDSTNRWQLENYAVTRFVEGRTEVERTAVKEVRSSLSADFLGLAVVEPESMALQDIVAYVRHLRANDLDTRGFETAFWSRISRMTAMLLVVMLALPFSLGPMRSSGQGARAVIGILIGAGYVLVSRTFESSGQIFDLAPWLVGWVPTIALGMLTLLLLARAR